MEYRTANEAFLSIEDEFDVFDIYINGIQVWDFMRLELSDQVQSVIRNQDTERRPDSSKSRDSRFHNWTCRNPFLSCEKELIFYSHGRRKLLQDGLWWDIYIDPILDDSRLNYLCLENNGDSNHPKPAKTDNLRYKDVLSDLSNIRDRFYRLKSPIDVDKKNKLEDISTSFQNKFGFDPQIAERVDDIIQNINKRIPIYSVWLQKIDPNAVVTWARPRYLILACKNLDIPVIELQHGVIHRYQYDYSYPGASNVDVFPDYLFTFGEYWTDIVDYPIENERVRATGYPFASKQFQKHKDRQKKPQILFLSQPSVGTRLSQLASEFALSNEDYRIVYKLHPREEDHWKSEYPWLQDKDMKIASSDSPPLYALFSESAVQVGISSTALFEGAIFDIDTYVLEHHKSAQVDYLLDNGAELIASATDLESYLTSGKSAIVESENALLLNEGEEVMDEVRSIIDLDE